MSRNYRLGKRDSSITNENYIDPNIIKEKNWDDRFYLGTIPPYDANKDPNYLSYGLMRSRLGYENYIAKDQLKR